MIIYKIFLYNDTVSSANVQANAADSSHLKINRRGEADRRGSYRNNIMNTLGAKAKYNSKTKTISVTKGSTKVEFVLGSRNIKVNGKIVKNVLDKGEQPQFVNKVPVLPAKEVAELFGYDCEYNQEWGMTTIRIVAAKD